MKFILTKELGKLARWLRILGFDTVYYKGDNLGPIIIQALREDRRIITRKKGIRYLQKRIMVVSSEKVQRQLKELQKKLDLDIKEDKIFTRCTVCNALLEEVKKENIKASLPEYVYRHQDCFRQCESCKKVYWKGSHWGDIKKGVSQLRGR